MRLRFLSLVLAVAPSLALAQLSDAYLAFENGDTFPARSAAFGAPLLQPVGPASLVATEPVRACETVENADDIEGTIALVERGDWAFALKVRNAVAAGAIAVVVYNTDTPEDDPDELLSMEGGCTPGQGCASPAAFLSYNSGTALLTEPVIRGEATLVPDPVCGDPPFTALLFTGVVATRLYADGFVGASPEDVCFPGFRFDGENGLYAGSILVGRDAEDDPAVTGDPYGGGEYERVELLTALDPPFGLPFADFDEGRETTLRSPLGVEVVERAYAREGDAFIVLDLTVTNTTDGRLDGLYVGLFADWDVGDASENLGGFDPAANLLYVYDDSGTSTTYFGLAALGEADVAGWTLATDEDATDASLFEGLTALGEELEEPQDARTVVGVGPFDLAAGDSAQARFAMLAGESLEAITASAQAAQSAVSVSVETATPEGPVVLGAAYPNPLASSATIGFVLPASAPVRLAVYDVLGREVALLADEVRPAGEQAVRLDASALPSGVYLVRLDAGGVELAQRLTIIH